MEIDNTDGMIGEIKAFVVPMDGPMVPLTNSLVLKENAFDIWDYTWNEYVDLSDDERRLFEEHEDFAAWLESVQKDPEIEDDSELPWDSGGKTPDAYSLEEYLALSEEYQAAFQAWFGSNDAFYAWMESQIGDDAPDLGDDEFDGMELSDFTMDDYFNMDATEQAIFKEKFFGGDDEALLAWIDSQIEMPDLSE